MGRKVLVTGAGGFLGSRLAQRLAELDCQVRVWVRRPENAAGLQRRGFRTWSGDLALAGEDDLRPALSGVETVFHLAAATSEENSGYKQARAINVETSIRLAKLSREAGASRFVFASSLSVKLKSLSIYGRTKKEAEDALLAAAPGAVNLRPAFIYGPGSKGLFAKLYGMIIKWPAVPVPAGPALLYPVHLDDAVEAFVQAGLALRLGRRVYELGGPDAVTLEEFVKRMTAAAGVHRITLPISWALLYAAAKTLGAVLPRQPMSVANILGLKESTGLDSSGTLEDLGFRPRPLDKGLRETFLSIKE